MKYLSISNDQKSTFCCGILASVPADNFVPVMCGDVILPSVVVVEAPSIVDDALPRSSSLFLGVTVPIASS